jgi:hypothetical protein
MKLSTQSRGVIRKVVSGIFMVLSLALLLAVMGCESAGNGQIITTGVTATTTDMPPTTATTTPSTTVADAPECPPAPAPQAPQPSPTPQPVIISYAVNNATADYGELITFSAQTQGDAASVRVVFGAIGGDISTTHNISVMLAESTSGGVTTWKTSATAPHGAKMPGSLGQCFYRIEVISSDGIFIKAMDDQHLFHVNG